MTPIPSPRPWRALVISFFAALTLAGCAARGSGVTGPPNTFITGPAESRWRASTGHDERPRRPARPYPNWPRRFAPGSTRTGSVRGERLVGGLGRRG